MSRNLIAMALANADEKEQAEVLDEFVLSLTALCKAHPLGDVTTQRYYIAKLIRKETVDFFEALAADWKYLNEECAKDRLAVDALRRRKQELQQEIQALEDRMDNVKNEA